MAIREGDRVMVISGKDVGRESRVAAVLPRQGRVIVEGINTASGIRRPGVGSCKPASSTRTCPSIFPT